MCLYKLQYDFYLTIQKLARSFPSEWAFQVDLEPETSQTAFIYSIEDSSNQLAYGLKWDGRINEIVLYIRKTQIVFKEAPAKFIIGYSRNSVLLYYGCKKAIIGRGKRFDKPTKGIIILDITFVSMWFIKSM